MQTVYVLEVRYESIIGIFAALETAEKVAACMVANHDCGKDEVIINQRIVYQSIHDFDKDGR